MEYEPLCISCDNYTQDGKCPYYQQIPFGIKNREIKCQYYSKGETEEDLMGKGAYNESNQV